MTINVTQERMPKVAAASGISSQNNLTHEQLIDCVEVGKAITSELDPDKLLSTIMDKVSKLLPSEIWSLLLLDEKTQELKFEISINLEIEKIKNFRFPLGKGVAGQTALQQKLIIIEDVKNCDFFDRNVDHFSGHNTESLISVPILYGGRTLGVLEVINPKSINPTIISLLTLLADYIAIAIENTRRFKRMRDMAVKDNLTGLYNQRYLYQSLKKLILASESTGNPLSLIFLDMDDFKFVVDNLGHINGSRTLREVGKRIAQCLTRPEFGVAYGGDEFVVVLPDTNRKKAAKIADKIRQVMKAEPYLIQWGYQVNITASFGVATFPEDAQDSTELLAYADKAMFRAKNTGKDAVLISAD
ncbi:MAG: sensor domain-containing diguanylate cyclase [Desulfobacteraceae bacterium]|nr:sensor domain-containing diguanylate cyclase [Desulfobacteraceae bacterium]